MDSKASGSAKNLKEEEHEFERALDEFYKGLEEELKEPDYETEDFEEEDDDPRGPTWYWYGDKHTGQVTILDEELSVRKSKVISDIVELLTKVLTFLLDEKTSAGEQDRIAGVSSYGSRRNGYSSPYEEDETGQVHLWTDLEEDPYI